VTSATIGASARQVDGPYSLRGANIREPLPWSKFLNQALGMWGGDAQVLFGMHRWPVWGNGAIVEHLELQRDMYRYNNDETLRLANHGYTMVEIAEMFEMPKAINKIVLRETTLKDAVASGAVKIAGNEAKLDEMLSYLDSFEFWFPIVTP
jgi:alkyl sulfatase BDS1-like metallo-beta-lactamase superfamily hydrolase